MQRSQEFASLQKKIFQQQYQTTESMKYQKLKNTLEKEIINETDVIFSTLDSCIKDCLNNTQIEAVIVDEAAISIEASLIIPLFHLPNKLILVGDHKQLRPSDLKVITKLERAGFYTSLYQRIFENYHHLCLLDTQYRMHPDILDFPNDQFYGNLIKNGVDPEDRKIVDIGFNGHINFVNEKEGREIKIGTSYFNEKEADDVFLIVRNLILSGVSKSKIGVITSYSQQVKLIREKCRDYRVKVNTVDSFQGSQCDYIIISTVRSNKNDRLSFISSPNRINVSITRARCFLVVIGNKEAIKSSENRYKDQAIADENAKSNSSPSLLSQSSSKSSISSHSTPQSLVTKSSQLLKDTTSTQIQYSNDSSILNTSKLMEEENHKNLESNFTRKALIKEKLNDDQTTSTPQHNSSHVIESETYQQNETDNTSATFLETQESEIVRHNELNIHNSEIKAYFPTSGRLDELASGSYESYGVSSNS